MPKNSDSIEDLSEFKGEQGKVNRWTKEIENSSEWEKNWRKEAEEYFQIYKDQAKGGEYAEERYNIFWANTQTLRPLVYSKLPEPNITRRFLDEDNVARTLSEMMERSVGYFMESTNADNVLSKVRDDFLIGGRGVARVVFDVDVIEVEKKESEEGEEVVEDIDLDTKKTSVKYVDWSDFRMSPAKQWTDVRWVAFRHKMNRAQLEEQFGAKGKKVRLQSNILTNLGDQYKDAIDEDIFKVAEVWEIWDKDSKKVIYMSPGLEGELLSEQDDLYNLEGFFPTPRPLGSDTDPCSLTPIPVYRMYQAQASELNRIDSRIKSLIEQIKFTGGYSSIAEGSDISSFLNGIDGQFTPLQLPPGTDINSAIYTKPIVELANVVSQLNQQKLQIINNIREITGLSDIVRGTTLASETATAQRLKGDFAISRIQPLQKDVERYARDLIQLEAELIVENYDVEELATITNLKVVDIQPIIAQAEQEIQRTNALLQEGLAQIGPTDPLAAQKAQELQAKAEQDIAVINQNLEQALKQPLNELKGYAVTPAELEAMDVMMKSNLARDFNVDVETDSTVRVSQDMEKAERAELVGAITNFAGAFTPLVQAGVITPSAFNAYLDFINAPYKVGRTLTEHLLAEEEVAQEPEGPSIQEQLAQAENARKDQELQLKAQEVNIKQQLADIKQAEVLQDQNQFEEKIDFEDANKAADRLAKSAESAADRRANTFQALVEDRTEVVGDVIRGVANA